MQMTTRSYIYNIKTGKRLILDVPATFRYGPNTKTTDLPMPGPDSWQDEGQDFGNQVEDVILWLHHVTRHLVDRIDRQESLGPAQLEYLPTPRSRKWRTGHTLPKYVPALHDREAEQLATQEGWAEWRYVDA